MAQKKCPHCSDRKKLRTDEEKEALLKRLRRAEGRKLYYQCKAYGGVEYSDPSDPYAAQHVSCAASGADDRF